MINIKYNVLALFQAIAGVTVSIFIIKNYGATNSSDSFLIAVTIIASINLLQLMFVEQFMYFYNDNRVISKSISNKFYSASFTLAILVGIGFYIVIHGFSDIITKIFVLGIDSKRNQLILDTFQVLLPAVVIYPASYVNERLLNAESKFSIPYIMETMPFLFMLVFLIFLDDHKQISMLADFRVYGLFFAFFLGIISVYSIGIKYKLGYKHQSLLEFIKNSFLMRSAHNIHNFSVVPITNNLLAFLPEGVASMYYYALRIVVIAKNIVVGPVYRVYQSKLSRLWSINEVRDIVAIQNFYFKYSLSFFTIAVVLGGVTLPYLLQIVAKGMLTTQEIDQIVLIFVALSFWYFVQVSESAFVAILMIAKDSKTFYLANSIFVFMYIFISISFLNNVGVYSIIIAGVIAQLVSCSIFWKKAKLTILIKQRVT